MQPSAFNMRLEARHASLRTQKHTLFATGLLHSPALLLIQLVLLLLLFLLQLAV